MRQTIRTSSPRRGIGAELRNYMSPQANTLTPDERTVLEAIRDLGLNAYGATIFDALGEKLSLGLIYVILHSLSIMGLVTLKRGEPTPERSMRAKLFAHLTEAGTEALKG